MVIRSIGVMSCAKVMGALYGAIGLIVGAFFALFSMIGMAAAPASSDANVGVFAAMFGVGAVIMMPIFYGFIGFIGGALSAVIYNVVAGVVGGIELDTA